jgi:hypothetical protein
MVPVCGSIPCGATLDKAGHWAEGITGSRKCEGSEMQKALCEFQFANVASRERRNW